MKNTEENKSRLSRIIKKTQTYSDLFLYPPFQTWKKDILDKRVSIYLKNASQANLDTTEGRDYAIRELFKYQDLKYISDDLFKTFEATEERARKELKKLDKIS